MLGGCVAARSSATEGFEERVDTLPRRLLSEIEVLEDREAVGAGARRLEDGGGELRLVEPEVLRRARQPVAHEAGVDLAGQLLVAAQPRGEQRGGARELAVVGAELRVQVVDRMDDLVLGAAARARRD